MNIVRGDMVLTLEDQDFLRSDDNVIMTFQNYPILVIVIKIICLMLKS